jgi:hypothetical protein
MRLSAIQLERRNAALMDAPKNIMPAAYARLTILDKSNMDDLNYWLGTI